MREIEVSVREYVDVSVLKDTSVICGSMVVVVREVEMSVREYVDVAVEKDTKVM